MKPGWFSSSSPSSSSCCVATGVADMLASASALPLLPFDLPLPLPFFGGRGALKPFFPDVPEDWAPADKGGNSSPTDEKYTGGGGCGHAGTML